jgi:hypothetical protein
MTVDPVTKGSYPMPEMQDELFRLLLDCTMQADPHPWSEEDDIALKSHLDAESERRGFDSGPGCWVVAYHSFYLDAPPQDESPSTPLCGAQDWATDDDDQPFIYGTCNKPLGHDTGWHTQRTPSGRLWAEWRGLHDDPSAWDRVTNPQLKTSHERDRR